MSWVEEPFARYTLLCQSLGRAAQRISRRAGRHLKSAASVPTNDGRGRQSGTIRSYCTARGTRSAWAGLGGRCKPHDLRPRRPPRAPSAAGPRVSATQREPDANRSDVPGSAPGLPVQRALLDIAWVMI